MNKFIDADRLKAEIEMRKMPFKKDIEDGVYPTYLCALMDFEEIITSHQQEQPEKSKKSCNDCPHCVERKDQYGWRFKGCFGGQYKGKFIAEINECPLKQEQSEANEVEKALSLQIQAYLTTASDELYAPGKPLYTKEHHEGIHECMKMWQKLHQYYFQTKQEQPENTLTFGGFVDKVGTWFAHLRLDKFRKTFDGETFPATELVQRYDLFVRELAKQYSDKQEQPDDLASLISEATNVAKRIVDRDSFYNSLPQNLRNKYTFEAWCEILEALSTMKGQKKPEVDIEKEAKECWDYIFPMGWDKNSRMVIIYEEFIAFARHFCNLGLNARKED